MRRRQRMRDLEVEHSFRELMEQVELMREATNELSELFDAIVDFNDQVQAIARGAD